VVYAAVGCSSVFAAIHGPAFKASVTDLVSWRDYARASGLVQLAEASRYLVAPVVAAFLMARFSLRTVLAIDATTFVLGSVAVLIAAPEEAAKDPTQSGLMEDLMQGVRYLRLNADVRRLLRITTMITFCSGMLQALFAPLVLSMADTATFGRIQSIAASGMLASSLLVATLGRSKTYAGALPASVAAMGVFFVLLGVSPTTVIVTAVAFCLFATLPSVNTGLEVLFRGRVENALQGRLWSLISLLSQVGMLAALAIAGFLADLMGGYAGLTTGSASALLIVFSGLWLLVYGLSGCRHRPPLGRSDREEPTITTACAGREEGVGG
jgi:hypothetical protein